MGKYFSDVVDKAIEDLYYCCDNDKAKAAADAAQALNLAAGLESRVSRVEDGIYNNITGNPFLVSFDSLDGIILVKGVWNEAQHRVEC